MNSPSSQQTGGTDGARSGLRAKEWISFLVLVLVYILFNFRYLEGELVQSVASTGMQLLTTSPVSIGLTILAVSFLQRVSQQKLPWDRVVRIYLTFGIITAFLYGLNEYWESAVK